MIHGLTPSLTEGRKIKTGGLGDSRPKSGGGTFRLPVKYDHFVVTKTTRDAKGDFEIDKLVMAALPKDADGQVRSIPIVLHSDNIDEVFPTSYGLYSGKKLLCHGDGKEATRYELDKATGLRSKEGKKIPCVCPYLNAKSGPVCKPHGTLHCSIALPNLAVAGSVDKWRTTSIISINRMIGSLNQIKQTFGTLVGVPLTLRVMGVQVTPPNLPPSTVYCCHVEVRAQDVLAIQEKALKMAEMRKALGNPEANTYRLMVTPPASDLETPEEQAEVQEEFFPEEADAAPSAAQAAPAKRAGSRMKSIVNAQTVKQDAPPPGVVDASGPANEEVPI